MGLFHREKGERPPRWWQHSKADWREFVGLVRDEASARGIEIVEEFEAGGFTFNGTMQVGLMNVSAQWSKIPQGERRAQLSGFMDKVMAAAALAGGEERTEDMRSSLRVSLQPIDVLPEADWLVRRNPCGSFYIQAVVDMEGAARSLTKKELAESGMSEEDAFELGSANVWRHEPYNVDRTSLGDSGQLTFVHGESMYTAAHALHLDRFLNPACASGALFIVPNRHFLMFARCDEPRLEDLARALAGLAVKAYGDEYPITPDLFWWRDGRMERIGGVVDGRYETRFPPELGAERSI
jgi:hypothetical protein